MAEPIFTFTADDLPSPDERNDGMVSFNGVTPKQRAEAPDVDALADRHVNAALGHLAAAHWLRTEYKPAKRPVYRDVVETVSLSFPVRVPVDSNSYISEEDWCAARRTMYLEHDTCQNFRFCGTVVNGSPVEVDGVMFQPYVHLFQATKTTRVLVDDEQEAD